MPRWKIIVEYHGGGFVGWQRQDNGLSIQQALEEAIAKFSGEDVRVTGAGRTDAGVHALGQAAHFDLARDTSPETVRDALNAHLRPLPVAVLSAETVAETFDARLSAKRRHYRYRILNRRAPEALEAGLVWHVAKPLDADAMHAAAQCLTGKHDFTTFRAAACQAKSPVKTLEAIAVRRLGSPLPDGKGDPISIQLDQIPGDEIVIEVSAPSFLHHQVRNFVGTLKLVGEGKWSADDVGQALQAKDRAAGGPTAPPQGLYFMAVDY